jgi:uncharacterized membrane protein YbhN (UPF0104 family)
MDRLTLAPRVRTWARALGILLAVATTASVARHVSIAPIAAALRGADVSMLCGVGLPLLAANLALRALRLRALLDAQGAWRASYPDVLRAVVLGHGANNVLPLRAGELVRTRELVARGGQLRPVALAQVTEKLVEIASMLAWITPGIDLLLPGRPRLVYAAEAMLLAGLAVWAMRTRRVGVSARAFLWSVLADGLDVALIAVCMASVGVHASLASSVVVLGTTNLAIALPSTPGQLGAFEAGAAVGLVLAGIPHDLALGFALVYRVVQWVPITLAAGAVWIGSDRIGGTPAPSLGGPSISNAAE